MILQQEWQDLEKVVSNAAHFLKFQRAMEDTVGTSHCSQQWPPLHSPTQALHLTPAVATRAALQLRNIPPT